MKTSYQLTKWDKYAMEVAIRTAQLSYCQRLQVGCVAVRDKRILCCGYNGTLPGFPNCCEIETLDGLKTRHDVEHAERNLIYYAAREGITLKDADIYCTVLPCIDCTRAIITAGFRRLFYLHEYRDLTGLELIQNAGIDVIKLSLEE